MVFVFVFPTNPLPWVVMFHQKSKFKKHHTPIGKVQLKVQKFYQIWQNETTNIGKCPHFFFCFFIILLWLNWENNDSTADECDSCMDTVEQNNLCPYLLNEMVMTQTEYQILNGCDSCFTQLATNCNNNSSNFLYFVILFKKLHICFLF